MATRGGVTRTCYTKIMNLFSSKILVQPFTGHVFFFFLSIFFVCFVIFFLLFFFLSFLLLLIIFFYLCIFFPLLFLAFSYIFFFSYLFYFFILICLVIFSFLYSHCHRSQTSQVMSCWRFPTTLPHAMHRSDILNFHRSIQQCMMLREF